jgi:hypothetical protein
VISSKKRKKEMKKRSKVKKMWGRWIDNRRWKENKRRYDRKTK